MAWYPAPLAEGKGLYATLKESSELATRVREVADRPFRHVLEDHRPELARGLAELGGERRRDLEGSPVGDQDRALVRLDGEAGADRVPGALFEEGIEGEVEKLASHAERLYPAGPRTPTLRA